MQNNILKNKTKFCLENNLTDFQFEILYLEFIKDEIKLKNKLDEMNIHKYDIESFKHFPRKNDCNNFSVVFYLDKRIYF